MPPSGFEDLQEVPSWSDRLTKTLCYVEIDGFTSFYEPKLDVGKVDQEPIVRVWSALNSNRIQLHVYLLSARDFSSLASNIPSSINFVMY